MRARLRSGGRSGNRTKEGTRIAVGSTAWGRKDKHGTSPPAAEPNIRSAANEDRASPVAHPGHAGRRTADPPGRAARPCLPDGRRRSTAHIVRAGRRGRIGRGASSRLGTGCGWGSGESPMAIRRTRRGSLTGGCGPAHSRASAEPQGLIWRGARVWFSGSECGCSSVGRALASQAKCRGFEPLHPLWPRRSKPPRSFHFCDAPCRPRRTSDPRSACRRTAFRGRSPSPCRPSRGSRRCCRW